MLVLAAPGVAWGHARLVRSLPADGGTVEAAPDQVDLWFNEVLDQEFNDVRVVPASSGEQDELSQRNQAGKPRVDPEDPTHLIVPVEGVTAGAWAIRWKVLSRDGHSAFGREEFKVTGTD
jgi:methionine-rich copper-binding protein CopC